MNRKYFHLSRALYNYVEGKRLGGPADLHRQFLLLLGPKRCPSYSAIKMAMRGERDLPAWVILFMIERMSFHMKWEWAMPEVDKDGNITKQNDPTFPFMKENKRLGGAR